MKKISRSVVTISDSEKLWFTRRNNGGYNPWDYVKTYSHPWSGSVIPNCTAFCYGYILKSVGYVANTTKKWAGNGCKWYTNSTNKYIDGKKVTGSLGSVPTVPSIICWGGVSGLPYGHVAIVTGYDSTTNRLTILESGQSLFSSLGGQGIYKAVFDCSSDFNYPLTSTSYPYQGCVPLYYTTTIGNESSSTNWTTTNWIGTNYTYLPTADMSNNAQMVAKYCQNQGWTLESTSALLGNMQQESTINPMLYQGRTASGDGYGLTQISHGMISGYSSGYDVTVHLLQELSLTTPTTADGWGDGEMQIISAILDGTFSGIWIKRDSWNTSGSDFINNTGNRTLHELTLIFEQNYENAGSPQMESRYTYADYWYNFLTQFWGSDTGNDDKKKESHKNKVNTKPWWKFFSR